MKKIALSLLLLVCLSFVGKAQQWYKLRPYTNTIAYDTNLAVSYKQPCVAGNGIILYGEIYNCNFGHCGGEIIAKSQDDLDTCKQVFFDGAIGPGFIYSIVSKNDSIHCFIYWNGSTSVIYTSNNFKTIDTIAVSHLFGYSNTTPASISPNFIYSSWQNPYIAGEDSLLIVRNSISTHLTTTYINAKYSYSTSLNFTSDSVGYMICSYRNDSLKSVLAITKDSGKTWNDSFLDSTHIITGCSFPTSSIGYLTENNGNIYKTTDGGGTWVKLTSPANGNVINCVSFSNDTLGYIGCDVGLLYYTTNGGTGWTMSLAKTAYNVMSLYTFGTVVYFVDNNNDIYKNESPMGIENLQAGANEVKIYPNPSGNGVFIIQLADSHWPIADSQIDIYNILGEKVHSQMSIVHYPLSIDLGNQPNGVYFYKISTDKGEFVASGKLVIQK
jgi:hypothetical protein